MNKKTTLALHKKIILAFFYILAVNTIFDFIFFMSNYFSPAPQFNLKITFFAFIIDFLIVIFGLIRKIKPVLLLVFPSEIIYSIYLTNFTSYYSNAIDLLLQSMVYMIYIYGISSMYYVSGSKYLKFHFSIPGVIITAAFSIFLSIVTLIKFF
ncbi:hypothetical protein [Serratia aquatilis]|uniref:Uncharacterized protein n=1 Tax=Serratia aquatilis TaxID=1737515 RepID=A0ABV6EH64_9GAMM